MDTIGAWSTSHLSAVLAVVHRGFRAGRASLRQIDAKRKLHHLRNSWTISVTPRNGSWTGSRGLSGVHWQGAATLRGLLAAKKSKAACALHGGSSGYNAVNCRFEVSRTLTVTVR